MADELISLAAKSGWRSQHTIARTQSGVLWTCYLSTDDDLIVAWSTTGETWNTSLTRVTGSGVADYFAPCIAVDSAGRIYVAYQKIRSSYDTKNGDVCISRRNTVGSWTEWDIEVEASMWTTGGLSLAVDSDDNLHIVYCSEALDESAGPTWIRNIRYAKSTNQGETWGSQAWLTDTYLEAYDPEIAISPTNTLHVVWLSFIDAPGHPEQVWYAEYTTSWQSPVQLSDDDTAKYETPNICIDDSSNIHAAWSSYGNSGAPNDYVGYKKRTSGTWGDIEYIQQDSEGYCFLTIDQAGIPYIVIEKYSNSDLYYSARVAGTWQEPTLILAGTVRLHGGMYAHWPKSGSIHVSSPITGFVALYIISTDNLYMTSGGGSSFTQTLYPTDAITRLTGYKHSYRRGGQYRTQHFLGGLATFENMGDILGNERKTRPPGDYNGKPVYPYPEPPPFMVAPDPYAPMKPRGPDIGRPGQIVGDRVPDPIDEEPPLWYKKGLY